MKEILLDYSVIEIRDKFVELGLKKFRATQTYEWLTSYIPFGEMSNLSKEDRELLNSKFVDLPLQIEKCFDSKTDGTKKFLYRLTETGDLIEGVLLKYKYGYTLCVSTQVGCRMGCKFCASGLDGLKRNLTAGEILSQVLAVNKYLGGTNTERLVTNVVLMGSGEPLDNFNNVVKFIRLVQSPSSLNISPRKITISTSGLVDKIYELTNLDLKMTLTVSLHATIDDVRKKIMKVANAYSVNDLMEALKYYYQKTNKRIAFEYILLDCNTTDEDVKNIIKISHMFDCHFNFIRYNYVKESGLTGLTEPQIQTFFNKVKSGGVSATVRRTLGSDVEGACGQLRRRYEGK